MKKSLFGLFFVGLLVAVSVYSLVSVGDAFPGKPVTSGELGEVVAAGVSRLPKELSTFDNPNPPCNGSAAAVSCVWDAVKKSCPSGPTAAASCVGDKNLNCIGAVVYHTKYHEDRVSCCVLTYRECTKKWLSDGCRASMDVKTVNSAQKKIVCVQGDGPLEP
jgi:hypothetical protein